VPAGAPIRIDIPAATPRRPARYAPWAAAAAGLLILLALLRALARRPSRPAATPAAPPSEPAEQLARRIAALDDAFAAGASPTAEERTAYAAERTRLKAELVAELAGHEGRA